MIAGSFYGNYNKRCVAYKYSFIQVNPTAPVAARKEIRRHQEPPLELIWSAWLAGIGSVGHQMLRRCWTNVSFWHLCSFYNWILSLGKQFCAHQRVLSFFCLLLFYFCFFLLYWLGVLAVYLFLSCSLLISLVWIINSFSNLLVEREFSSSWISSLDVWFRTWRNKITTLLSVSTTTLHSVENVESISGYPDTNTPEIVLVNIVKIQGSYFHVCTITQRRASELI